MPQPEDGLGEVRAVTHRGWPFVYRQTVNETTSSIGPNDWRNRHSYNGLVINDEYPMGYAQALTTARTSP
ncbi:MAG: hypothetical protein MJK04_18850, partial [Psychrosphaera sp.]|nr:hypothetical protein [Psychrosphaera sp.]